MTPIALVTTVGVVLTAQPIAPVRGGNALTLPAQRHVLRLQPPGGAAIWLLAVQQDGRDGRGLGLYRSDDETQTWQYLAPLQNDWTERDTADLVAVGMDVALVYSFEAPALRGSRRHDVYFQWWRYQPSRRTWAPEPPVLVFDSTADTSAFSRAELARDSLGRLWVQAFRLEPGGASTAVIAVSTDGGRTFRPQTPLVRTSRRGGGRLLSLGTKLLFLYAMHDGFQPTRFRMREDSAPLDAWGPVTVAFSEGIYHGAALSAAVAPGGGMHLVYKAEDERLYYRAFDGAVFGPRKLLVQPGDWALQPALTRVGSQLYVFYNRPVKLNEAYELTYRIISEGTVSSPVVLDGSRSFKGYLAAPEVLPSDAARIPCMFGTATHASLPGQVAMVSVGRNGSTRPPATPPPSGQPLFSDDFGRSGLGLGPDWEPSATLWLADGRAVSERDQSGAATERRVRCGDCQVEALVTTFGAAEAGVFLRAPSPAAQERYELVLLSTRKIRIRRHRGSEVTVLGEASSGVSILSSPVRLELLAEGSSPVTLTALVNGEIRLTVTDTSRDALGEPGYAGMCTIRAGVVFDAFRLKPAR